MHLTIGARIPRLLYILKSGQPAIRFKAAAKVAAHDAWMELPPRYCAACWPSIEDHADADRRTLAELPLETAFQMSGTLKLACQITITSEPRSTLFGFAGRCSKADIRSANGQYVGGAEIWSQPMSMADIDLRSYVFWHTACKSRKGNTLVPQDQTSFEGGRRERAASGCSFCLSATSQESGIHGRGYFDVGSGYLRKRHGVQLD